MHDLNKQAETASSVDKDERARNAVKVFRGMQAGLSSYARAITRNPKVRVEVSAGPPRTDGTTIFYRPPIALGDPQKHDRFMCDKRDIDGLQACPACRVREEVLVNIYHEIAHIAYDTFAATTERAKRDALDAAIAEWGGKYETQLRKRILDAGARQAGSYLGLASIVSPFLPHLLNAMEDARVDSSMFAARKGTRKMLAADTINLLRKGIPTDDPDVVQLWHERELNAQISLACYLETVGYNGWREYLHEKIVETVDDPILQDLYAKLRIASSAAEVYNLAFPMLARLRELGYMLAPEEQPQPEQEEEQDGDDQGDAGDAADDAGDSGEADGDDDAGDSAQDGEGDAADSASDPGDEAGDDGDSSGDPSGGGEASGEEDSSGPGGGDSSTPDGSGEEGLPGVGELPEGEGSDDSSPELSDGDAGSDPEGSTDEAGGSGGYQGSQDDLGGSSEPLQDQGELSDADSNGVPEKPAGQGSDGGSDQEPDSQGGGEAGSTEQPGEGADEAADEVGDDLGHGGDHSEGGEDESADGDDTEQLHDEQDGSEPGQLDDGSLPGPGGEGSGEVQDLGPSGEPVDPGQADLQDGVDEEGESRGDRDRPESNGELIDSGADEGKGGVKVNVEDTPEFGDAEDVAAAYEQMHPHLEPGMEVSIHGTPEEQDAISAAILLGTYFEWPSTGVSDVQEHSYSSDAHGWATGAMDEDDQKAYGIICDVDIPESVLGGALLKTRKIFDDNKTASYQKNMRSGRVNARVLGRRAWNDDDRLFGKRRLPGKKDYAVQIMVDVSSSNLGMNLALVKRAAFAQAELLHRVGIPFSITAHSCSGMRVNGNVGYVMHLHHVKDWNEPWNDKTKAAMAGLVGTGGNLDGHAMEYGRKQLSRIEATDKIFLYYTDGKFPAANKEEELEVLLHQLKLCKRDQITLLGVGIRTDSPSRFGLDTVEVNDDSDLQRVVEHLGKRLQRSAR